MTEVLGYIDAQMEEIGIPYEFMMWTAKVTYPYFVGEYSETDPATEDGLEDKTFILTGTTRNSWAELIEAQEKIKKHFNSITGKTAILDSGSGIAVFYSTSFPVPTGEEELKRLQINLNIKLWKVE
ncbi:MAG: hypothetical protein R3Y58_14465 [Eubacteriales bacterium]